MIRKTLLATTALVLGASVAFAAHESGKMSSKVLSRIGNDRPGAAMLNTKGTHQGVVHNRSHFTPGAIFSNFSKDANAEFVSWYGFTALASQYSYYENSTYHYKVEETGNNATAFTGTGKAPKSATAPGFGYSSAYKFDVAILSDHSGLPGSAVATTSAFSWPDTSLCCTSATTANFSHAPKLGKGTTYFVSVQCASSPCDGGWNMENIDFSGASIDYWHIKVYETYRYTGYTTTETYSYSSPWHESTSIPSTGAVVINK